MIKIQEYLAFNMKLHRKRMHLTQAQLAELCNTSTNYIGTIEICKKFPSADMLQEIANALKIKPYELFIDSNNFNNIHYKTLKEKTEFTKNKIIKEIKVIIDKNFCEF